jgi:hypothetical protein
MLVIEFSNANIPLSSKSSLRTIPAGPDVIHAVVRQRGESSMERRHEPL